MPLDKEPEGWMPVEDAQPDMFVLQVAGNSMEPDIPDGAFCLFRAGSALGGSRNGRIVLVQNPGRIDPETGSTFTVKKYFSSKTADPITGWHHDKIILKPTNSDYEEIHLHPGSGEEFSVIAEFFRVIEL
jgi:SOS-response transcriptional repressor LexA